MNRADYEADRRARRSAAGPREDRGLPHHPDGSGFAQCLACEGAGETIHNDSWCNDPQDDYPISCSKCNATGLIPDGEADTLLELRKIRRDLKFFPSHRSLLGARHNYGAIRQRAMAPVCLPEAMQAPASFRLEHAA